MPVLAAILAKATSTGSVVPYARKLGGPGLLLIGMADSSIVPTFGSMDVALVLLAARVPQQWLFFAFMALLGSVIGGYLTFRLGRKGGQETLERRFSKEKLETVYHWTERHAFWAVSVPSFLPPPAPTTPFLLAAGAMEVSTQKFLLAYVSARACRYALVGWLGARYGRKLLVWFDHYRQPLIVGLIAAAVAGTAFGVWRWQRKKRQQQDSPNSEPKAA